MSITDLIHIAELMGVIVGTVGAIVVATTYVLYKRKRGLDLVDKENSGLRDETINLLKEQRDAYKTQFESNDAIVKELTKKVSYLQGVIDERDKKEAWYKEIFTAALTNHLNAHPEAIKDLKTQV